MLNDGDGTVDPRSQFVSTRQKNLKRGSLAGCAYHMNRAVMGADNRLHNSQPQAPARELSAVEWIENFPFYLFCHAAAGIRDLKLHVVPRWQVVRGVWRYTLAHERCAYRNHSFI